MKLPRVPANGDTRKTVPKQFNVSPPGENDLYIREFLPNRVHAEDTQGSRDIFNAKFLFDNTIEPEELVKYKFETMNDKDSLHKGFPKFTKHVVYD